MKTLLACLVASTALATAVQTHAYKIIINEDSADRFDFTVTFPDLEVFIMLQVPESPDEGESLVNLVSFPGYPVWITAGWAAWPPFNQFTVAAPFGAMNVVGFTGKQILEISPKNVDDPPALRFVYGLAIEPSTDEDGDGIPDDQDGCPGSILPPTVLIGACDTGVVNTVDASGCTLADRVIPAVEAAAAGARNHGRYVSAVARYLNGLVAEGVIGLEDHEAIMSCVARKAGRDR